MSLFSWSSDSELLESTFRRLRLLSFEEMEGIRLFEGLSGLSAVIVTSIWGFAMLEYSYRGSEDFFLLYGLRLMVLRLLRICRNVCKRPIFQSTYGVSKKRFNFAARRDTQLEPERRTAPYWHPVAMGQPLKREVCERGRENRNVQNIRASAPSRLHSRVV